MSQVTVNEEAVKSDLKRSLRDNLQQNEDEIREFIERKLIEEDQFRVADSIVKGVDMDSQGSREELHRKTMEIVNNLYDTSKVNRAVEVFMKVISKGLDVTFESGRLAKEGAKTIISSVSDFYSYAEELRYKGRVGSVLNDLIMGGTGGLLISGAGIGFVMMVMFPVQTASAIGAVGIASFAGSLAVGAVKEYMPKMKSLLDAAPM